MAHQYVQRAPSGIFHLRIPVPPAARGLIGRREIKRTLRTRDLSRALALARRYLPDILERVDAARQTMDDEKLKRLLSDPNRRFAELTVKVKNPLDGLELQFEVDPNKPGDTEAATKIIRDLQTGAHPPVSATVVTPPATPAAHPAPQAPAEASAGDNPRTVLELFDEYADYKEREGDWTANTRAEVHPRFVVFHELVHELPISQITAPDADTWRKRLHDLPTNYRKRYPGLSVQEVLKRAANTAQRGAPLIDSATIRKHVQSIRPFFHWLVCSVPP